MKGWSANPRPTRFDCKCLTHLTCRRQYPSTVKPRQLPTAVEWVDTRTYHSLLVYKGPGGPRPTRCDYSCHLTCRRQYPSTVKPRQLPTAAPRHAFRPQPAIQRSVKDGGCTNKFWCNNFRHGMLHCCVRIRYAHAGFIALLDQVCRGTAILNPRRTVQLVPPRTLPSHHISVASFFLFSRLELYASFSKLHQLLPRKQASSLPRQAVQPQSTKRHLHHSFLLCFVHCQLPATADVLPVVGQWDEPRTTARVW